MRTAEQRRLTPLLAGACVLALLALAALAAGIGRQVRWDDTGAPAARLPSAQGTAALPPAPPLSHYADIWQRPLFSSDRRPAPTSFGDDADEASLGDLELTGIILSPSLHMALLRNRKSGVEVRVREGEGVAGGRWTLHSLAARSATFVGDGGRTVLPLKVAAHIDRTSPGAPAADPRAAASRAQGVQVGAPPRSQPAQAGRPRMSLQPSQAIHAPTAAQIQAGNAQKARIKALRKRIEDQRQRQSSSAHDGDH